VPPLIAALVALRGQHHLMDPGPEAQWSELSTNLSLLFLGSLAAQALSYSAALGAIVLANGKKEREMAADFIVGFFLARIPILLFQAVQAALLPKLAGLAGSGQHADFRSGLRKLVVIVMGIGLLGILGGVTIGPEVGKILFGDSFHLDRVDLGLLFAGSAAFILALTLAQALIALQGHGRALVAWVVGLVGVIVGIAATTGSEFLNRVEVGFLVGCSAAAVTMALLLLTRLRAATPESLSRLVEQIEHEPLEI
jgi:O-antigen/teichoic acid export membrane protein